MIAPLPRRVAARLHSDRRRLATGLLSLLFLGLSFGYGYIAALSVGSMDAITPDEQPLVATIDHRGAGLAAPQPATAGIVVGRPVHLDVDPLRPVQDRAPPALAS